uniref:ATP-binding cassette transporter subfamily D member 3 n=1 Tax=Brachionus plicatilis TaxID=10195 RepID=A0A7H9SN34_BRAPC|nr:ATP-binding cassette transporter subfamily D member 3 [Brachionus plicatilis]
MSAFSKFLQNPLMRRNAIMLASSMVFAYWSSMKIINYRNRRLAKHQKSDSSVLFKKKNEKKEKVAVDKHFFRNLKRLLKIIIPNWFSAEVGYLILVAVSLIARTYADVFMIMIGTSIESSIISGNLNNLIGHLAKYVSAMPFISLINNLLKYGIDELKLRFRTRMTKFLYSKYLRNLTYYKMNNLDNRIANADQLLTQDVERFCNSFTELYSNLSKPILDVGIYSVKLTAAIGAQGPAMMLGYLFVSGVFLTMLRKPVAQMTVKEQHNEGEFRHMNARLITNSEEVAFYQGHKREEINLMSSYNRLENHLRNFITFRFSMGFIDNIVAKYFATFIGYNVVSMPFMKNDNHLAKENYNIRLENYYRSGRMLVKLAEALGRISLAGREMTRLAGFTERVTQIINVIDDLNRGQYKRTMVKHDNESGKVAQTVELKPNSGEIIYQDNIIRFEKVPLMTPNGDVLIKELSFEVRSGVNVLVCGPNGCGKSSLFRTLGELWPLFGGTVTKPEKGKLFYIPQKPYMTIGSLRDQVIYPDTVDDMKHKHIKDADLVKLLDIVKLSYLLEREGGWNSVQDWIDVLSGGEKQRIAMARLFYHKPQFAILDECTSAVSVDVEGNMYEFCKSVGITLFTVSHRKSLWKYHEYYLRMDGQGSFEYLPIDKDTEEFGS